MTAAAPRPTISDSVHQRRWWTLGVLCLSLLIVSIANSSLNVALPSLARDLGASESQLQWVVASYSLVFAGLLFSAGALGDRFGRKGALQFGLVTFFVAAAAASQATTMGQIIGCRAVMGLGAAFIMPSTLSILVNVFPAGERAKAIAIWAATVGVAGAIGPLMSGFLLTHFWFGSVFLINLPIIALALVGGWVLVPKSRDPQEARLDPVGALLSIVGISSLVFALIQAPDKGWGAPQTVGAFVVALVVLAFFVLWELHTDEPMLDMSFFRNPSFSTGSGGMLLVFLAMYGVLFLMTQYFQLVLNDSPLTAALRLLPMAPIMLIVAPLTPQLSKRFGANRVVGTGMGLIGLGFLVFSQFGLHTSYWIVVLMLVPLVSGMAMSMSPMTAAIMAAVPARRAGAGSAMNDATRELGAALGVAVLGSIATSQYSSHLHDALGRLPAASRSAASSSIGGALDAAKALPTAAAHAFDLLARTAFLDGMRVAGLFGAALALAAAVVTARYLPQSLPDEGALHSHFDALENAAELGLGGVPPVFADERFPGDAAHHNCPTDTVPAMTSVPEHPV
jgi:EmrB/QacA subfamily drug resistance transporter